MRRPHRCALAALAAVLAAMFFAAPGSITAAAAEDGDGQWTTIDRARFVLAESGSPPSNPSSRSVTLPDAWEVTNPGATGEAVYTLEWTLDQLPTMPQALYLTAITVPTSVYVNGDLVGASGPLDGRAPRSYEQSQLILVPPDSLHVRTNYIALRVRSRVPDVAGMGPVLAGNASDLREHAREDFLRHTMGPAAISIATLTVGAFIFVLWLRRRDSGYALFATAVMLWSAHTLVTLAPEPLLPQPHWTVMWTSVYLLFVAMLCLFCVRFAGVRWPTYEQVVIGYACATVPLLYIASALGALAPATTWLRLGGIGIVAVALWAVTRYAMRRWSLESALLLIAGGISAIFAMHDWLVSQDPLALRPVWLVPYAALAFLTLFGYLLTDRFVRALNESERLNADLERRVEEKSAALSVQLQVTEAAKEAAEAANRAKSSFLAAASHDLRQPLHALGMFSQALAEHTQDAEGKALVQRINTSVASLEALFSALLDISKLDAGAVTADLHDVALRPLLDRLVDESMPEALDRGLKLAVVCGDVVVRSDPVLLERIVRNLVTNALRYTERGGVVIGCRPRGGGYAIEVWDSGAGIPEPELDRIFEEFYQVGNPSRDRARGLGLGLAIVRRLANLLGHSVEVDSRVGRGSVFRVRVAAGEHGTVGSSIVAASPGDALAGRRILVVDDEADVRDGTTRLLSQWGCDVVAVADAAAARDRCMGAGWPDAMIVDFRLSDGTDGLAAIAELRAAFGSEVPAVLISGESAPAALARIRASGLALLHKPLPPARLRSVLAHALTLRARSAPSVESTARTSM